MEPTDSSTMPATRRKVLALPGTITQAPLKSVDLHALQSGSKAEVTSLLEAAITDGFFYLDFSHSSYNKILDSIDTTLDLNANIFNHDQETKNCFDIDVISKMKTNGYKPKGRNIVSKDGDRDSFESWALSRNGLLHLTADPFLYPPLVAAYTESLNCLLDGLGSAAQTIFKSLSTAMSLDLGERFEDFHDQHRPSPDILRLLKYHSSNKDILPQTPHTDLGSLTFVFSLTPGLQVLPHTSLTQHESDWVFVEPRANCAVVNFGDCMTMLTGGLIKSSLHRVGPLPGESMKERYSFAYLMRPQDDTLLRPVKSPLVPAASEDGPRETLTSGKWIARKFQVLRGTKMTREVLTGGRDVVS